MIARTEKNDTPKGVLTLVGQNTGKTFPADVRRSVFLLSRDGRSVDKIKLECEWDGSDSYSFDLNNEQGNQFKGTFQRVKKETKELISQGPISCGLFDSQSEHALLLSTSPLTDSGDWDFDWKVELVTIERLPYEEWNA